MGTLGGNGLNSDENATNYDELKNALLKRYNKG